jgi:ABC-type multidrug transport system permease subunit
MLRTGKVAILVRPTADGYEYRFDPTRPEAALARAKLDDALQRAAGRADAVPAGEVHVSEPGARYIDFLVPGLIGMNLMGGGLWGVGFVTVDMRIRKLLKRLIATPMRKRDFLLATVGGRMLFTLPEMAVLLLAAWLMFNVTMVGSLSATIVIILIGAMSFAGLGLLIACRASKIETVSGLMNVVMLPMWILSGTFFSSERFPDAMQPFVQALPLTQLNNALRGVMLEGESLASQAMPLLILTAWGGGSFVLGLRWFRWT